MEHLHHYYRKEIDVRIKTSSKDWWLQFTNFQQTMTAFDCAHKMKAINFIGNIYRAYLQHVFNLETAAKISVATRKIHKCLIRNWATDFLLTGEQTGELWNLGWKRIRRITKLHTAKIVRNEIPKQNPKI